MKVQTIDVAHVRASFVYNPESGAITRASTGKVAVYMRHGAMSVSYLSNNLAATRIVYILVHGKNPVGLRTRFVDGDVSNLRMSNLDFATNSVGAPGSTRTLARIVDALRELGGKGSTPLIRKLAKIPSREPISSYMVILERRGEAHICGMDAAHFERTGRATYMWALGPGSGRPAEVLKVAQDMRKRRESIGVVKRSKMSLKEQTAIAANEAVSKALAGHVPSSVFSLGAQFV